jgi:hypothetical protein
MTPAERQRRHRKNKSEGLIIIPALVNEVALAEMLVSSGFVPRHLAHDRQALKAAVEELLKRLVAIHISRHT